MMMDAPKTATEVMMLDMEGQRIERRDRAVAMSVAAEMVERFYKPEAIEDMRDVRKQITRAAEFAAYTAIQKERELHLGDMEMLRKWSDIKWAEQMLKSPAVTVETHPKA